ncbi:transmembrane protein 107-like isoform X2 [Thrips palmi]|uniref:Transmembrane protein 107 n=1 Tax=Thrips palmi TaxID=161013 RepID=A0A6P8ZUW4_THRPL|nr:transmembrane protein 107-like isoform X2 [Thrips palmi]
MAPCTTNRIVPTRFLTLISHFTIAVIALWAKDENVQASLPVDHTASDFSVKANEMTVGLSLAIAFIGLELVGFLSGVSFFMPFISLICILFTLYPASYCSSLQCNCAACTFFI